MLRLYREIYFDLHIRHFHEKLCQEHRIKSRYSWVQKALQGAGLVAKGRQPTRPVCYGLKQSRSSRVAPSKKKEWQRGTFACSFLLLPVEGDFGWRRELCVSTPA